MQTDRADPSLFLSRSRQLVRLSGSSTPPPKSLFKSIYFICDNFTSLNWFNISLPLDTQVPQKWAVFYFVVLNSSRHRTEGLRHARQALHTLSNRLSPLFYFVSR